LDKVLDEVMDQKFQDDIDGGHLTEADLKFQAELKKGCF